AGGIVWSIRPGIGMRNTATSTKPCEENRVFDLLDGRRAVTDKCPMLCDARKELGPILKAAAANRAARIAARRQHVARINQLGGVNAWPVVRFYPHVGLRGRNGVLIAEKIRHQRRISSAPRRSRQRATRRGGDQHRRSASH